jgi:hypothetical protein
VGLAVTITGDTSPRIAVHYYSGSPQVLTMAQRFWDHPAQGLNPLFEAALIVRCGLRPRRPGLRRGPYCGSCSSARSATRSTSDFDR